MPSFPTNDSNGAILGRVGEWLRETFATKSEVGVVLSPSGVTTGGTDVAAINAALVAGDVTLRGGTFYTNAPIRIPSNRTLTVQDSTVQLVDGSNCNVVQNYNQNTTGDDNIALVGVGRARLIGGNASTQPDSSAYNSIGTTFTHVRNLKVRGLEIGPCRGPAMVVQGIDTGVIESIHINHDRTNNNQDGIDVGPSTHNLAIRGITGVTEDDGFALFAETSAGFCHAMYKYDGVPATGISNVTISDVSLNVGIHPIRLQAGGGLTLKGVHVSNYRNTNTEASIFGVIIVGPIGGLGVPAAADISDITLDGYHGPGNVIISVQSNFSNVDVRDVTLTGPWKTFLGTEQASTNYEGTVENVSFDNIKTLENASGATLLNTFTGTYTNISVTNVNIRRMTNMLNNYGTFTGMFMSGINIHQLSGKLIASNIRETGVVDNVQVSWSPSTSLYTVQPTRLKLGQNMPFLQPEDLTPSAATKGSIVTCRAGKDPTGGTSANGGRYIANGATWVLETDLGPDF